MPFGSHQPNHDLLRRINLWIVLALYFTFSVLCMLFSDISYTIFDYLHCYIYISSSSNDIYIMPCFCSASVNYSGIILYYYYYYLIQLYYLVQLAFRNATKIHFLLSIPKGASTSTRKGLVNILPNLIFFFFLLLMHFEVVKCKVNNPMWYF